MGEIVKEKYIVYWQHTVLEHSVIGAYSPAEARYIMEQRLKKNRYFEPEVDSVMSVREERKLNSSRDYSGGPGYGA